MSPQAESSDSTSRKRSSSSANLEPAPPREYSRNKKCVVNHDGSPEKYSSSFTENGPVQVPFTGISQEPPIEQPPQNKQLQQTMTPPEAEDEPARNIDHEMPYAEYKVWALKWIKHGNEETKKYWDLFIAERDGWQLDKNQQQQWLEATNTAFEVIKQGLNDDLAKQQQLYKKKGEELTAVQLQLNLSNKTLIGLKESILDAGNKFGVNGDNLSACDILDEIYSLTSQFVDEYKKQKAQTYAQTNNGQTMIGQQNDEVNETYKAQNLRIEQLETQLRDEQGQAKFLNKQLEDETVRVERLERELKDQRAKVEGLEGELKNERVKVEGLEGELKDERDQFNQLGEQLKTEESKTKDLASEKTRLETEIYFSKLSADTAALALTDSANTQSTALKEMEAAYQSKEASHMKTVKSEREAEKLAHDAKLQATQNRLDAVEAEKKALIESLTPTEASENDILQAQLQKAAEQEEIKAARMKNIEKEKKLDNREVVMKAHVKAIRYLIPDLKEDLKQAKKETEEAQDETKAAREQNRALVRTHIRQEKERVASEVKRIKDQIESRSRRQRNLRPRRTLSVPNFRVAPARISQSMTFFTSGSKTTSHLDTSDDDSSSNNVTVESNKSVTSIESDIPVPNTDGSRNESEDSSPCAGDIQAISLDTEMILQAKTVSVTETVVDGDSDGDDEEPFPMLKIFARPVNLLILFIVCFLLQGLMVFAFKDTDLWEDLMYSLTSSEIVPSLKAILLFVLGNGQC